MHPRRRHGDRVFVTPYANARQLIAWVLGLGEHARILGPPELVAELRERVELLIERHTGEPPDRRRRSTRAGAATAAERPDRSRSRTPATATTPTARSAPSASRGW